MSELAACVPVLPVLAKADTMTGEELKASCHMLMLHHLASTNSVHLTKRLFVACTRVGGQECFGVSIWAAPPLPVADVTGQEQAQANAAMVVCVC